MNVTDVLPRDAIPSIDEPAFGTEFFGAPDDDVLVVEANPARAYPVRILSYHEIVNDVLGTDGAPEPVETDHTTTDDDQPIAVTWCPICGSGVVYDRTADGRTLTFGTSGKLADDALVMYDRETGSEWKQPLGTAIAGPLEGTELDVIPAPMLTWAEFQSAYPDGVVLQPVHGSENDPHGRSPQAAYDMSRYDQYDASENFGLRAMRGEGRDRTWKREDIDAKTVVLGIIDGDEAVGYPVPTIEAEGGLIVDSVGELNVIVVTTERGIAAFENPGFEFTFRDGTLYADGTSWGGMTGRSDDGRQLSRIPSRRLYAFAWQDDHGRESFYGLDDPAGS